MAIAPLAQEVDYIPDRNSLPEYGHHARNQSPAECPQQIQKEFSA